MDALACPWTSRQVPDVILTACHHTNESNDGIWPLFAGASVLVDSIWRQHQDGTLLPRVLWRCFEVLCWIMAADGHAQVRSGVASSCLSFHSRDVVDAQ